MPPIHRVRTSSFVITLILSRGGAWASVGYYFLCYKAAMLTTSERAQLILNIGTSLSAKLSRAQIVAVLNQFVEVVPALAHEEPDTEKFIFDTIQNASDVTLEGLSQIAPTLFANPSKTYLAQNTPPLPAFWNNSHLRIFISHMSEHKKYAQEVKKSLKLFGVGGFVAHDDIQPTKLWTDEIFIALRTSHALVALLHSGFHTNKYTDQEIGFMMGQGKPTCSAKLGEEPYGFIGFYQAFSVGDPKNTRKLAVEITKAFARHELTRDAAADAVVGAFHKCYSFDHSREFWEIIKVANLKPSHASILSAAAKENGEILHSSIYKELENLIKKLQNS